MVVNDNVSLLVFLAVGVVLPFLVDLVTKQLASGALKQTVLLALSLVSGVLVEFITTIQAGGSFDWTTAAYGAVTAFATGVVVFKGLDATPILGRTGVISQAVPGGLGKEQAIVEAPPVVANPAVENPADEV